MKKLPITFVITLVCLLWPNTQHAQSATHKVMVPAYFFPYDKANPGKYNVGPYWADLIDAATQYKDRLIVIANVANGPVAADSWAYQKYFEAITKVRKAGGIVLGYIHLCYGLESQSTACSKRTMDDIKGDLTMWAAKYNVDGFFFDEVPTTPGKLSWLQTVDKAARDEVKSGFETLWRNDDGTYASNPNRKLYVVMHYGTTPDAAYIKAAQDWIHSVCERPTDLFPPGGTAQPNVAGALQAVSYSQQKLLGKPSGALLYQQSGSAPNQQADNIRARVEQQIKDRKTYSDFRFTWDDAKAKLLQSGFSYIYVTDDGADGNPWDRLPPFFWRLF